MTAAGPVLPKSEHPLNVIVATDCGSTTTKAILIEKIGDEYRQTYRGEAPTTVEAPFEDVTRGVLNAIREVGDLVRRAKAGGRRLATLALDTEVRFRSASDRAAFSTELTEAIARLVSKYHDESAPGGRAHRLVLVAHPLPQRSEPEKPS